ncbi:Sensory/regulatory protein RpfC [Delftia tsuruhatensis]|uniref:ATP-binding response regulator n=1 Tax=Delftia tsuruhatensis TaxID=180282 RepID=UPI001E7C3998|nr:hybrid sensor histidine kinase/response regulator [Delftia tsuruhatensis]CAB5685464.1 Sensory/regulatory protein RpfC [Delftia tsuruhatensis]CAC9690168.1 Sensory/regulatory protein RpfC [Delftia tsuruhatensis]
MASDLTPCERSALVALLYRQSRAVLLANFVIPVPVLAVLWPYGPHSTLLAWAGLVLVVTLARLVLGLAHARHADPAHSRAWAWYFTVGSSVSSALWGWLGWALYLPGQPQLVAFVCIVIAGLSCGTIASFAAFAPAAAIAQVLLVLPFAARSFTVGEGLAQVYGVFALCLFAVNLYYSRGTYNTLLASVRLRFENAALVEQLKIERDRAETANLAKSRFLAAASHDLRQPLHALGLFLDSLERHAMSPRQATVFGHARSASAAASEMLNTLLDYSRLDAGVVQPHAAPFAVQPLLGALEQEFGVQADAACLVYRTRETTAAALADKVLVDLVMRNLISNALRYTQTGGVLVTCRPREAGLALEVWDTGSGIAEEHQQDIFKEFHQLGNSERDRRKGLGLGLAIVQRLAHAMQARVQVRSRPGRGSVFRLWLPLWSGTLEDEACPAAAATSSLHGLRILVIDDDEAVRQGMQSLLESWGCRCICAESGADALAGLHADRSPDVIVTDFRLRNEETGKQALQALRGHLGWPVPAIIMTGDTSPQRLRDAQSTAALLLHKPVSTRQLREALGTLAQARKLSPA